MGTLDSKINDDLDVFEDNQRSCAELSHLSYRMLEVNPHFDVDLKVLSVKELVELKNIIIFMQRFSQQIHGFVPRILRERIKDRIFANVHFDKAERAEARDRLTNDVVRAKRDRLAEFTLRKEALLAKIDSIIDEKNLLDSVDRISLEAFLHYVSEVKVRVRGGGSTLDREMLRGRIKVGDKLVQPSEKRPYITIDRNDSHQNNLEFVMEWLERTKFFHNEALANGPSKTREEMLRRLRLKRIQGD